MNIFTFVLIFPSSFKTRITKSFRLFVPFRKVLFRKYTYDILRMYVKDPHFKYINPFPSHNKRPNYKI